MARPQPDASVAALRAFNRFHTRIAGALDRTYLDTELSLAEARVVYEMAAEPGVTATGIRERAGFDQAHLSRVLARLRQRGLVRATRSEADARVLHLHLSRSGERVFRAIDQRAVSDASAHLDTLDDDGRRRLVAHLGASRLLLGDRTGQPVLRRERRGDLGWAFMRQAELYAEEFGYDRVFDAYVAEGLAPYLRHHDAKRDGLWVAEWHGARIGCVAVHHVDDEPGWAKLRWYFVEKEARGRGVGKRLLRRAVSFAKRAGYAGVFLWTVNDLEAAARQYAGAGFRLAEETKGCPWALWGREQRWELDLSANAR